MSRLAIFGGPKECQNPWPEWPVHDECEIEAVTEVLKSGNWWYGPKVREFEEAFARFQNAGFGITTNSGTTALETGLIGLGIGRGDEVIVPPYTFIATASSVLRVGAVPVFADIQPRTACIDPDDVERKINPGTKAIMPVHLAGCMADMDRLQDIASKHSLFIIEDACHAWGSKWNEKGAGAIGNCGAFSFQLTKNITSGEGGILLTDDEDFADVFRSLSNCGRVRGGRWYEHQRVGSNFRMTEFQAAILLVQLSRLGRQTALRQTNADIIYDGIRDLPGIRAFENDPRMNTRSYHLYVFRLDLDLLSITREQFVDALVAEGVPASAGYSEPLYRSEMFTGADVDYSALCPVCESICEDAVWITHPALLSDESDVKAIVTSIQKIVENVGELRE